MAINDLRDELNKLFAAIAPFMWVCCTHVTWLLDECRSPITRQQIVSQFVPQVLATMLSSNWDKQHAHGGTLDIQQPLVTWNNVHDVHSYSPF
jgi:hypothetical protein